MNMLKVKKESLAKRCEICHQRDCFDEVANYCLRCKGIKSLIKPISKETKSIRLNFREGSWNILKDKIYLAIKVLFGSFLAAISTKAIFEISFNLSSNPLDWHYQELFTHLCIFGYIGSVKGCFITLPIKLAFCIKPAKYKLICGVILGLFFGYFMSGLGMVSLCFIDKSIADYLQWCNLLFSMVIGMVVGLIVAFENKSRWLFIFRFLRIVAEYCAEQTLQRTRVVGSSRLADRPRR
jgi:hypothetical protein